MYIKNSFLFPDTISVRDCNDNLIATIMVDTILPEMLLDNMDDNCYDILERFLLTNKVCYISTLEMKLEYRGKRLSYKVLELLHNEMKSKGFNYTLLTPMPSDDPIFRDASEHWNTLLNIYNKSGYRVLSSFEYHTEYTDEMVILIKEL